MPKTTTTKTTASKNTKTVTTQKGAAKKGGKKEVGKAGKPTVTLKKARLAKRDNPLYESKPKNFGIGQQIQPKRDLTRFVKWPKYVRVQRQKRILLQRLKVPGTVNQFNYTADKNTTQSLFNLLNKYRPEGRKEKRERLKGEAKRVAAAKAKARKEYKEALEKDPNTQPTVTVSQKKTRKPYVVKYGLKHVTALVESKKAKLVIIAHDVDPLELVLWLPTLCKKKDVPYIIVKGKSNLGKIVRKKTAAVLAVTSVKRVHEKDLEVLVQKARDNYNNRYSEIVKKTGGQIMGPKHVAKKIKIEKLKAKEPQK
jgi:large subunit ribosomal protein L7Ae